MASRYARLDVDFMSKNTAQTLLTELGPWGPLLFVALILKAKDGSPPGTFSYTTDTVGWDRLGILDPPDDVTLDQFLAVTGRLKQTRRTCVGRVKNVTLTRYGDWQMDSKRYEGAVKKARLRAHSGGDKKGIDEGTQQGLDGGPRPTSITNPPTPHLRRNGNTRPKRNTPAFTCPKCHHTFDRQDHLETHLEWSGCSGKYDEASAGA